MGVDTNLYTALPRCRGKIEFYSAQADRLGLPPLPLHKVDKSSQYPLALSLRKRRKSARGAIIIRFAVAHLGSDSAYLF